MMYRHIRGLSVLIAAIGLPGFGCTHAKQPDAPSPQSTIQFQDVTAKAGIRFDRINGAVGKKWLPETMGGGGAFIDYDNDGWQDVLLLNGDYIGGVHKTGAPYTLAFYHNNKDGTFTDVTKQVGLDVTLNAMGVAVGDYDNDGYDDLFITAIGGSRLYHNVPDGRGGRKFVDVTASSGIHDDGWPTSAAWVDYDRDGKLDLFVCHYLQWSVESDVFCGTTFKAYCGPQLYKGEPSRLYHNDGGGKFTDVTVKAGVFNSMSKALGVCICDVDGDGWPDIIVANDTTSNCLYRNNQHGGFTEIGLQAGIALSSRGKGRAGMGVDKSDYQNNGNLGIAIGNFSQEGMGFYDIPRSAAILATDRAQAAGLYAPSFPDLSFGLFFADFDNDGWQDLLVTNGHIESDIARVNPGERFDEPNLVFRNNANGTFADVSASAGTCITDLMVGRAACRGDFDNDGLMDALLVCNAGAPRLLKNTTRTANHWITLKLIGTKGNRDAYGASVSIMAGKMQQSQYLSSGSSYLSANDNRLHFGLGASTIVNSISVRWPTGVVEAWNSIKADRIVTITEGVAGR